MGTEIERKFLVADESWRPAVESSAVLRQGYLAIDEGSTVRVRTDGAAAWLTIKGPADGLTRAEFEWAVPWAEADALLELCRGRVVEKTRHKLRSGDHLWEIDEFAGSNAGLIVAEIELHREDELFAKPPWLGSEVSGDRRFDNARLSLRPQGLGAIRLPH
ncbi:MAG: CYTH domain-containing protein [Chthoniobacterales bacterium]